MKMNKVNIFLLLISLLVNAQTINKQIVNTCLQDEIDMSEIVPKDYLETFDENYGNRNLQTSQPQPIRITLDFKEFDNPNNGDGLTLNLKEYLKKIMFAAQNYLSKLIKVYPRQKPIKFNWSGDTCYDVKVTEEIKTVGIDNSDLHIYVTYSNEPNTTYLANAIWCQLDPNPNIGRVKFNIGTMDIDESSPQSFQDNFSTSLHEILHILGFSGSSVSYWIDPDTNKPYGGQNESKVMKRENRWEVDNVLKVFSKNILRVSRNHYTCPSIDGMYLENQGGGGSMGSHWERDLLGNEFMTASIVYGVYTISEFTAALLLDTGYYAEINSNLLMPIYWGKNKGCDFFNKSCNTGKYFPEFPDDSVHESCDFFSQGIGSLQKYDFFSQCKTISAYSNAYCESDEFKPDERLRQNTGAGSRCFRSNANIKGNEILDMNGRCFKSECNNDLSSIRVNVWGDEYVTCNYPDQVINLADQTKHTQGTMRCPHDFDLFCKFPKSCPNKCSNNGVCNNGYCVCLKGQAGVDCSQRCEENQVWDGSCCVNNCPAGQFKNLDNTCKPTCPYKQFGDRITGSCILCSVNCSACFGASFNQCLSCNNGYTLQENQCIDTTCHPSCISCLGPNTNQCSSCVSGTYLDSRKTCQPCQFPCDNCFNSATECTTCRQGYQMDKFSGKCVSMSTCDSSCLQCSAFRDPTKCTSCREGFFLNNEGRCQKCNESCATCTEREDKCLKCTDGWEYDDSQNRRCYIQCHQSCDTCTTRQDPTACKTCAFNYFMMNNICVPCDKNCYGCREDTKKCTSCNRGFRLDLNTQSCVAVCRQDEFLDMNYTCQKCILPCATCKYYHDYCSSCVAGYTYDEQYKSCQPTKNTCHQSCSQCNRFDDPKSCTSCRDGMYLLLGRCQYCSDRCKTCEKDVNICTSCQDNQFLQNKQCFQCHSSCLTCSGISTNCTSCQDGYSKDSKTGLCVDSKIICKNYEYLDRNNQCQNCSQPCASCFYYPNRCSSCILGFKLNQQTYQCQQEIITCKAGQFLDFDNKCKPCDASCTTCEQTSTRCTSCRHGFTLSRNSCQSTTCQDDSFLNQQGVCQRCSESCSKCINNQDNCTQCAPSYSFDSKVQRCVKNSKNQQCHTSCKECSQSNNPQACISCNNSQYLNNKGQCLACDKSCLTCSRQQYFCTSCEQGFKLDQTYGKCIPDCKQDQYLDYQQNMCKPCASPCGNCEYYADRCTSCISGYKYDNQRYSCEIVCQPGQFIDKDQTCKPCQSPCGNCEYYADRCTSCISGYKYDDDRKSCEIVCQTGQFVDSDLTCKSCQSPCATCEYYENRCMSCVSGYSYNNYYCEQNTRSSFRGCHESCNTCTKSMDPRSCDSCREGYVLNNGSCLKKRGNYFDPKN